jgi:hypothetical protein
VRKDYPWDTSVVENVVTFLPGWRLIQVARSGRRAFLRYDLNLIDFAAFCRLLHPSERAYKIPAIVQEVRTNIA